MNMRRGRQVSIIATSAGRRHRFFSRIALVMMTAAMLVFESALYGLPPGERAPDYLLDYQATSPGAIAGWGVKGQRARKAAAARSMGIAPGNVAVAVATEHLRMPVVLVRFPDKPDPMQPQTSLLLQAALFGPGPTPVTMASYYNEVSYGRVSLDGMIYEANMGQPFTHYRSFGSFGNVTQVIDYALRGSPGLDAAIDFGAFDNDGPDDVPNSGDDDGMVDVFTIAYVYVPGMFGNFISHQGWYAAGHPSRMPFVTDDPRRDNANLPIPNQFIRINTYIAGDALKGPRCVGGFYAEAACDTTLDCFGGTCDTTPGITDQIGTWCHEMGHGAFDFKDHYDEFLPADYVSPPGAAGVSSGSGQWDLMATGGQNKQSSPAHLTAWSKARMGWLEPQIASAPGRYEFRPVEEFPDAIRIDIRNGEYFLIENRQPIGSDVNLRGTGLAIYHITESEQLYSMINIYPNCTPRSGAPYIERTGRHFTIALEQADGMCDLEHPTNKGADAGDLFDGSVGKNTFDAGTTPSSRSNAGTDVGISVTNISQLGPVLSADITPATAPPTFPNAALDVVFLIDVSGSKYNVVAEVASKMRNLANEIRAVYPNSRFGLASFSDFPLHSGYSGDYAYRRELDLTTNISALVAASDELFTLHGGDQKEAQYEALYQLVTGEGLDLNDDVDYTDPGEIPPNQAMSWRPDRVPVIYLKTESAFHDPVVDGNYPQPFQGRNARGEGGLTLKLVNLPASSFSRIPVIYVLSPTSSPPLLIGGEDKIPAYTEFELQARRLADLTRGGFQYIEPQASNMEEAVQETLITLGALLATEPPPASIPTVSQWGLVFLTLLILTAAKVAGRRV